jgi:hypothetical protein
MPTSTRTRTPAAAAPATPQRFTVTADVLLTLDVEAGSPAEALDAYRALRLARPELHGRGGVTVFLPADSPAVATTEAGKEALRVDRVGTSEGRKPSRFNPAGQRQHGDGQRDQGEAGDLDRPG